ncbi:hypothetical protein B0H14DRAFT_2382020 [Mycena olivaceomarginata]|nr:hypothetical protein B0H14DRAFT_2382020 [Mycena olivaceomarginata]
MYFCPKAYAGVNAKSMWRRHVLDKHRIRLAKRRCGPAVGDVASRNCCFTETDIPSANK